MLHAPAASAKAAQHAAAVDFGSISSANTSKASVNRASPARMAVASSNALWHVGRPRRKSSLSNAGRSSWISE